jgi:hypothetical protein
MSIYALKCSKELRDAGGVLGRTNLSQRVIDLIAEYDGSYKGAMTLAGKLKAIGQAAKFDGYWTEKVDEGYHRELQALKKLAARRS